LTVFFTAIITAILTITAAVPAFVFAVVIFRSEASVFITLPVFGGFAA
jgi:hypothetical protein